MNSTDDGTNLSPGYWGVLSGDEKYINWYMLNREYEYNNVFDTLSMENYMVFRIPLGAVDII